MVLHFSFALVIFQRASNRPSPRLFSFSRGPAARSGKTTTRAEWEKKQKDLPGKWLDLEMTWSCDPLHQICMSFARVLHAWSCARLCEWKHTSLWVQDMERKLTCRQYYIPNKRVHFLNTCGWNWFIASSTFACCFQLNTHCLSQDAVWCWLFC